MRLGVVIIGIVVLALIGLWIYGETLQPKTTLIEQEALRSHEVRP
jgi:hypothetical protein